MEATLDQQIAELINLFQHNPKGYFNEVLGITQTWEMQDRLIESCPKAIKENKQIYVASGHSLGKDYICAGIALWFLDCYIPSKVILTAPTDRQVKKIMWGETLEKWNKKKIKFWGKAFTSPYIEITKENHFLIGFTTKETGASADSSGGKFQGFHSSSVCVIVSEAQAVEDSIYDQIDAITTSENCLVIFIGNPTRAKGRFAAGLRDYRRNIVFNFSCLDNPNYQKRQTIIPGLASYEWVEDKRIKWGEGDPRWVGRVLGQIPDIAINNTYPLSLISHMKSRYGFLARHGDNSGVSIDPSGEGVDENVFISGNSGEPLNVFTKTIMSPVEVALKGVEMCKAINGKFIVIDCDGIGIGPYQELTRLPDDYLKGIQIIKFHGSAPSSLSDAGASGSDEKSRRIYENMRAEAAFVARDRAYAGRAAVNEFDTELIEDLQEEEYFTNKSGRIQIEPKEDLKERLGRSPGRGDAWKMLQWAFDQNFEDKTGYRTEDSRLPRYGMIDDNQAEFSGSMPRYGIHN